MTGRDRAIAVWAESDWTDIAAFIGPNADRFHGVYERGREKALAKGVGNVVSWSWPALFFGFAWFFYRKQWAIGAVLLIVPILIAYFFDIGGGLGGVAIVMAMFAKSFIVQDAVTRVAKLKSQGATAADLTTAGGVSVPAGVVGGILLALLVTAALIPLFLPSCAPGAELIFQPC